MDPKHVLLLLGVISIALMASGTAGSQASLGLDLATGDILGGALDMIDTNNNMAGFLWAIRNCEGTAGLDGYSELFGGGHFASFADHPRLVITSSNGYKSSAAGAYQIIQPTWDNTIQPALHLPDFSPASQDAAAVFLIQNAGAYDDVMAGNLASAVAKCAPVWASLPGTPTPQGNGPKSLSQVATWYEQGGGVQAS